jgi:hypothetical protein
MNFKKNLAISIFSVLCTSSYATYIVQYPNVPISFKNLGQWIQNEPTYTNWLNIGSPYDCGSENPLENTQPLGITYVKTFSGCHQAQERIMTTSEKNTVSGVIRNSVDTKETKLLTDASYTVNAVGSKIVKECGYTVGNTFWADAAQTNWPAYTTTYGSLIMWKGTTIKSNITTTTTSPKTATFVSAGYVYTRGTFMMNYTFSEQNRLDYYYNQICREPVSP